MKMDIKKMCVLGMLSALAYVVMVAGRIPVIMFLSYDPKDVVITIGGFLYGPLAAFIMTVIVSFIEAFTVSDTGPIGLLMNIIAGSAFACTASFIYKKHRSLKGAVSGLAAAWIMMTAVMILWNYLITPIFMEVPRQQVASMLIPIFLPFNLIKGGLNAAITMLLYKPVKAMLEKSNLMPPPEDDVKGKFNLGVVFASGFVILTCVLWVLVLQGRL
ncbi:MAG: ECF transporter S component [Defluviitaleaceae bacterium]|nr:ECF transporter S component [Defluviitaleaceae bacterium]